MLDFFTFVGFGDLGNVFRSFKMEIGRSYPGILNVIFS
jgi:hypothetical protein